VVERIARLEVIGREMNGGFGIWLRYDVVDGVARDFGFGLIWEIEVVLQVWARKDFGSEFGDALMMVL
jgi:hypothetical protein